MDWNKLTEDERLIVGESQKGTLEGGHRTL